MEVKAYFSSLTEVTISHLETAESQIIAVIEYFSNKKIYDVLCKKAQLGVQVSIILNEENNPRADRLNFFKLESLGGKVKFLPSNSQSSPATQHSFCVIDQDQVLTGAYSWCHKKTNSDENITLIKNSKEIVNRYLGTFNDLLKRLKEETPVIVDTEAARRRLEMIRNLILLGEQSELNPQVDRLRSLSGSLNLNKIIASLDNGQYQEALEKINVYLSRATGLVAADDNEILRLQFHLQILELRLESLDNEQADLERSLIVFNRRHDELLGSFIRDVLKTRAEYARLIAKSKQNSQEWEAAEAEARRAEESYERYSNQHEELQQAQPLPILNQDEEAHLRSIYRKACAICHPDRVEDEQKRAAHEIFIDLQEAYRNNDITRVNEIYTRARDGNFNRIRTTTLSQVDKLKAIIAEFDYNISQRLVELKNLQNSNAVKRMESAGVTEAEWQYFFEQESRQLKAELSRLEEAISHLQENNENMERRDG